MSDISQVGDHSRPTPRSAYVIFNFKYRIFSIKRRGRLFKTRPRSPGVYTNPAFIRSPAFIY